LGQFRGSSEGELVCWLQEVFHTTLLDMLRNAFAGKRTPELEVALAAANESSARLERFLADTAASPSRLAEGREVLLRFAAAVEQLPPEQQDAVLLRDVHGLSVKEISERMGRTEKAVAGLLARGRLALRAAFPDYRGDTHG
jgi:RNA polymerase sigma-70 factor (ECF subfamily)